VGSCTPLKLTGNFLRAQNLTITVCNFSDHENTEFCLFHLIVSF
jgi:hypothetical protein